MGAPALEAAWVIVAFNKGREMGRNKDKHGGEVDGGIVRRDFLNGALLGVGASLLGAPAPAQEAASRTRGGADAWTGYGGVGEYGNANGNTWPVMTSAHRIR